MIRTRYEDVCIRIHDRCSTCVGFQAIQSEPVWGEPLPDVDSL